MDEGGCFRATPDILEPLGAGFVWLFSGSKFVGDDIAKGYLLLIFFPRIKILHNPKLVTDCIFTV